MSDASRPVFRINDLLVSIVPAAPDAGPPVADPPNPGGGYMHGTILTLAVAGWPGTDEPICDANHGIAANNGDSTLLAGVKALLKTQIAALEAEVPVVTPDLAPANLDDVKVLEAKLEAALDAVRQRRADLESVIKP